MRRSTCQVLVVGLALVAALATGSAFAQSAPTTSRLAVALNADIRSLEPGVNRDTNTDTVIHQLFEGLVAYKTDLDVGPALAESWTLSDEGRSYTFKLRPATFHNGKPVTSAEMKWSWDRLNQSSAWTCRPVFNGQSGAKVVAVETPDPQTVVFKLDRASAIFLKQLANIQCHVLAMHPDSVDTEGKWSRPIGSGPLKLREWRRAEYVLLDKFAEYRGSAAPANGFSGARDMLVEQVLFQVIPDPSAREAALLTGAVDILHDIEPDQIETMKQRGMRVLSTPGLGWSALLLQTDDPLLSNVKIRQAIAHAIDLKQIAEAQTLGMAPANASAVSSSTAFYNAGFAAWPAYDPARARALLKEAGYKGEPLRLQTNKQYQSMYQNSVMIEQMLAGAGFAVKLEVIDWATQLSNYLNGRFQMQSFGYSGRFDPALMYAAFVGDKTRFKTAQYGDPDAVALLGQLDTTDDPAVRGKLFAALHAKVQADVPIVGLYFSPIIEAVHPRVEGYVSWPANRPITWGVRKR
ncbi:ABC transporter substrate-binding protein [Bosea vaviloviae]|uniref:ABC transporter substrate-binding protein n=1 Tax=Bosea vaviloviae TaxID=1526658 RepID=A0A1D7U2M1_9HYPH|nr:ABC transporter substrate-binding protein [Bosea vaviloviae]AOO81625.1 ABC transporter substrate-binding protein [Bosea vaviloviae]